METVYDLFGITPTTSPNVILEKCKEYCNRWTFNSVLQKLTERMGALEASLHAHKVFKKGETYLKTMAAMLLDPSARQCYDAWLDTCSSSNEQRRTLTRSRILWFNNNSDSILFSENMLEDLKPKKEAIVIKKNNKRFRLTPQCRSCRKDFNLSGEYLVLHCHCTTRVGHSSCMVDFSKKNKGKCPVCRQILLKRRQISKYLFWNVKEKYKVIA